MTEQIGKFVQFDHEPDEREIEHEKRALAAQIADALLDLCCVVKPHGDSGDWTVGISCVVMDTLTYRRLVHPDTGGSTTLQNPQNGREIPPIGWDSRGR